MQDLTTRDYVLALLSVAGWCLVGIVPVMTAAYIWG